MWPMLLDYSRDECKRMLRRLELDAYSSIVSVFRAQGDLSKDKKKLLQDLQSMLRSLSSAYFHIYATALIIYSLEI